MHWAQAERRHRRSKAPRYASSAPSIPAAKRRLGEASARVSRSGCALPPLLPSGVAGRGLPRRNNGGRSAEECEESRGPRRRGVRVIDERARCDAQSGACIIAHGAAAGGGAFHKSAQTSTHSFTQYARLRKPAHANARLSATLRYVAAAQRTLLEHNQLAALAHRAQTRRARAAAHGLASVTARVACAAPRTRACRL
jgi:hypothetical protein